MTTTTTPVPDPDVVAEDHPTPTSADPTEHHFGGLVLTAGPDVIKPRLWTIAQSRWAAEISDGLPDGPLLELCAGCGVIGLEAARLTDRPAVLVDASGEACGWAEHNAAANGLADRVEVLHGRAGDAVAAGERFPLILVDPPYLPRDEVDDHPDDPVTAIDGGPDGLAVPAEVMAVAARHLSPGGAIILQLRGLAQIAAFDEMVRSDPALAGLSMREVRITDPLRALALLTEKLPTDELPTDRWSAAG